MRVDLRKTTEFIRWSDDPDAKEYEISFTDEGLEDMLQALEKAKEALKNVSKDKAGSAAAIEEFVTAIAGRECYEDALAYVDVNHVGAENCAAAMLPLVIGLADFVSDRVASFKADRIEHYMRLSGAQADLV